MDSFKGMLGQTLQMSQCSCTDWPSWLDTSAAWGGRRRGSWWISLLLPLAWILETGLLSWGLIALILSSAATSRTRKRLSMTCLWRCRCCGILSEGFSRARTCCHYQRLDGSWSVIWIHLFLTPPLSSSGPGRLCPRWDESWHSSQPGRCRRQWSASFPICCYHWSRCPGLGDHWPPRSMPWGFCQSWGRVQGFRTAFQWHQASLS